MPQITDLSGVNASQNLLEARSQGLVQRAQQAQNTQDKSKIEGAAKQFEAILLQKWLEDAQNSFAKVPGEDPETADPGQDQFRSLAMQQLAEKMTASGGIGIATMIVRQLSSRQDIAAPLQVTDSKEVTNGVLPARNEIKVPQGKDR
jgi:Rod binding domain-containing protein